MDKNSLQSFSSVISVDPYNDTYFSGVSTLLTQEIVPKYLKNQFTISYLNTNDFINSQISISRNIPDEDLYDAITNKVYDELALDQAIEYSIQFIETFNTLDDKNRTFQIFIVDPLILKEKYKNVIAKIKYIDVIIPSSLLLKLLYSKNIIQSGEAHCFIYIQKDDAFISVYKEKEFVYTKSIHYSLIDLYKRFCELYTEHIEYDEFIDFISNENFRQTNSPYKNHILKLYKELFSNINDILTYVRRAFDIEKIEHLYIGLQIPTLSKIYEIAEYELNIRSSDFNFDYGFKNNNLYIDELHSLMHIYTTVSKNDKYQNNFTIFLRPPKFIHRQSGKFTLLLIASFVIAFSYPVTYWVLTYSQSLQYKLLNKKYISLHNKKITREATIKLKEADKKKIDTLLSNEEQEYMDKKNTLIKIHDVKVNYPMKSKLIALLTKDLNTFNVKVKLLSYSNKKIKLYLISNKEKRITELVKYLTSTYHNRFHFSLENISFQKESNDYFSELEMYIL